MAQEKDSIHKGHRARMKSSVRENGIDTLNDHQVLEVLLFYAVANGDTNPSAHRLVNTFGSLKGVLEADYEKLLEVNGIGENAANLIKFTQQLSKRYLIETAAQKITDAADTDRLRGYFETVFLGVRHEEVHALIVDGNMNAVKEEKLSGGSIEKVPVSARMLAEFAIKNDSSRIVLAHNHPNSICLPSSADVSHTMVLKEALSMIEIELADHIIVGCNGSLSMKAAGYMD